MTIFVGTSGWAYREWKPEFYPAEVPQSRFLEHYVTRLTACEINATFYRLQSDTTFQRWSAAAPEDFRFAIKAHRRITHSRSMKPTEDARRFINVFLKSLAPLGPKVGTLLLQYPPTRERDDDGLHAMLDVLARERAFAFEFRHDSWVHSDVQRMIAAAGGAVCVADTSAEAPSSLPPGPFAYVRLRAERYTDRQRERWLELLEREGRQRDVFVFSKHEGIPAGDEYGGVGLAQWLRERIRTEQP